MGIFYVNGKARRWSTSIEEYCYVSHVKAKDQYYFSLFKVKAD